VKHFRTLDQFQKHVAEKLSLLPAVRALYTGKSPPSFDHVPSPWRRNARMCSCDDLVMDMSLCNEARLADSRVPRCLQSTEGR
jgi:hypothetical protein